MKTFDELFDSFFNNKNKKTRRKSKPKKDDVDNGLEKIIEALSNFKQIEEHDLESEYDLEMGEPIKVQYFEDNGLFFKRSVWNVEKNGEKGELVKLEVSDVPFEDKETDKTLEQCLEDALNNEDYEKAAEIRDKINNLKK